MAKDAREKKPCANACSAGVDAAAAAIDNVAMQRCESSDDVHVEAADSLPVRVPVFYGGINDAGRFFVIHQRRQERTKRLATSFDRKMNLSDKQQQQNEVDPKTPVACLNKMLQLCT